jgi:type IV secretory pathway VirJ component
MLLGINMATGRLPGCYFIAIALILISQTLSADKVKEEKLIQASFGELDVYRPEQEPKGLVLLLSGEGGWSSDMVALAKVVVGLNYLVAGIDIDGYRQWLATEELTCANPATELEALGRFLADRYHLPDHKAPILVGYGVGAALVYGALMQAPVKTFHAAISLDFCPRLVVQKNLCRGRALESKAAPDGKSIELLPAKQLQIPWFLFQSEQACDKDTVVQFVNQTEGAKLVYVDGGSHEATEQKKWLPQFSALLQWLDPSITDQVQADTDVGGVPLTEVLATGSTKDKRLAVMISGDGGWAALDRTVAAGLAKSGIDTVGWDSLSYFWKAKTPDRAGVDLERVLRHYLALWQKERILLIGYSFGADVLPFMASRLSAELCDRVELVAFLGLSNYASFEFHLTDWMGFGSTKEALPVRPEVAKLGWTKRLCIYGEEETESACPDLANAGVVVIKMPGDHHFGGDYPSIVKHLLEQIQP